MTKNFVDTDRKYWEYRKKYWEEKICGRKKNKKTRETKLL